MQPNRFATKDIEVRDFKIPQIKGKFGALRVYLRSTPCSRSKLEKLLTQPKSDPKFYARFTNLKPQQLKKYQLTDLFFVFKNG